MTNGKEINHLEDFEVLTNKIKEIKGDNKVRTIEFEDGTTLDIDGIFIAMGEAGSSDFAKRIGVLTSKDDNIIVDENMATNVEGLYSCGNSTGGTSMAKYCENCGKELNDGADVCLGCGKSLNKNVAQASGKTVDEYAKSGFTFGLISIAAWLIPLFGYPVTIIAIYNAVKGLGSEKNKGKAIAGLILGILFLVVTLCNSIAGVLMNLEQI